jgi:hypothetical protein
MPTRFSANVVPLVIIGLASAADASATLDSLDSPAAFSYALASAALAHHGPGTSGGGSATISGETLKQGSWDVDLREDYTSFKRYSRAEAEAHAAASGEFDAVDQSFNTSASVAYGITDDFQLALTTGYYYASNFVSADRNEQGAVESGTADPAGLTDLWLTGKYRVMKGQPGNLSVVAGVKFPTGRSDVTLDNGERLEPSSQPGSGAWDFQGGLAYSRFLTSRWTIDASVLYTLRTKRDDFKVGDRFDTGVAFAYRITEDINQFPQWSVFAEANGVWVQKDHPEEGSNPNTGGTTIYLTPGTRVRFSQHVALTVAPSIPVYQDLNGDQDETQFKAAATLSFSF